MTVSVYHRDILALLRDDYGVTDAELARGGNHFTYAGEPYHVTLNNTAHSPRAFDMKRQDIRRLLGAKLPRPTRVRKTMEEMMSEFNPLPLQALANSVNDLATLKKLPSISAQGRLAIYDNAVRFEVPGELAVAFDDAIRSVPVPVVVKRVDDEMWEISRSRNNKRPVLGLSTRSQKYETNSSARTNSDALCGMSPAEYLVEGDVILVRCPLATRITLAANAGKQKSRRRKAVAAAALLPEPTKQSPLFDSDRRYRTLPDQTTTEADLRACLDTLRRIEATTPYRLGRRTLTDAWCFSAPRIE